MNLKNKYYVVRHGECDFNVISINDSHGHPDNHLTQKGIEQITTCAQNFKDEGIIFEKIISSPFPRTRESAEIFLKSLDVNDKEISQTSLLKEMDHGTEMRGKLIVRRQEKDTAHEEMHSPHGDGESFWDVRDRMLAMILELESKHENKNLLLVTHGTPVWMFYSAANELDEEQTLLFKNQRKTEVGYFIKNAEPIIIP